MTTLPSLNPQTADILVVDDTVENLKLLSGILTGAGYRVRPTERPFAALESALAHPPGLILLDVRMPELDGYELCRRLKLDERTHDVPVIFVSALQDTDDRVQGFDAGGVDFVSKPFQESEVLARVKTHLQFHNLQLYLEELVAERTAELQKTNEALQLEIAERIQAEQTVRESEERFRMTFEQAAVGIAHVALNGRFLRLNQKFCDIVGYSQDEMLPLTFQDITHSEDIYADLQKTRTLLEKEAETYTFEKRYIHKQGHIIWVNLTVSLLWDESGEPKWFVAVIEDITERKQLQEERDRILNTSQDLICVVGMDGYFKYLNPAWEKILGYTAKELLSRPFLDFIYPDDHNQTDDEVASLAAGHTTVDFENRYICKDGSIRTISWVATRILAEQLLYCIGRDITERKQTEEALRESERDLLEAQRMAHIGNWKWDIQADIMTWSDEVYRIYGIPLGTLITNDRLMEIIHPDDQVYHNEQTAEWLENQGGNPFEYRVVRPDGAIRYIFGRGGVTCDEGGNPIYMFGTLQDITERKLIEQDVQAYQHRLQALAADLTLAEERERRRIAANLHDNVSQSLALARIQLGTARKVSSETRRDDMLDEVSQTLLEAIRDTRTLIFDLSSPLLNELGLETAVSAWLRDQIGSPYNLETEFHDDGQEKPLTEDMRAILFRNVRELLTNVVRHAQAAKVEVSLARLGVMIQIIIQDDGVGFDPQVTTQQVHSQGGFGLFSIQERMADLGGSCVIKSAPNEGCTVLLTAPLNLSD